MHLISTQHERFRPFPLIALNSPPYPHSKVIRCAREVLPARAKGQRPHGGRVPCESRKVVPVIVWVVDEELYGIVVGAGGKDLFSLVG